MKTISIFYFSVKIAALEIVVELEVEVEIEVEVLIEVSINNPLDDAEAVGKVIDFTVVNQLQLRLDFSKRLFDKNQK